MNRESNTKFTARGLSLAVALLLGSAAAVAQVPVDEYGSPVAAIDERTSANASAYEQDAGNYETVILGFAELEELVGPIALYPDDLLAIVLPASAYPLEIVQAARFLEQLETDSSLEPDPDWDESVVALLNYPEVLRMLDEDIDWTWTLGEAVINQQEDVVAAVESFRDRAYAAGNLRSDEHQEVTNSEGIIEIVPIEDDVIYVPYYEPERVVVRQPTRVYHYYPRSYPVYYYPYPAGYTFGAGYFWGVTTAYRIGWLSDSLHVRHPSYWGHPYFGHSYYGHYYRRPSLNVYNSWYGDYRYRATPYYKRYGDHWRPRRHDRNGNRHKGRNRSVGDRSYARDASGSHGRNDRKVFADGPGYRDTSTNRQSPKRKRNTTDNNVDLRASSNDSRATRRNDQSQQRNGNRNVNGGRNSRAQDEIRFRPRDENDAVASSRENYSRRESVNRNRSINRESNRGGREQIKATPASSNALVARNNPASNRRSESPGRSNRESSRSSQTRSTKADNRKASTTNRTPDRSRAQSKPRNTASRSTRSESRSASKNVARAEKSSQRGSSRNNERRSQRR